MVHKRSEISAEMLAAFYGVGGGLLPDAGCRSSVPVNFAEYGDAFGGLVDYVERIPAR